MAVLASAVFALVMWTVPGSSSNPTRPITAWDRGVRDVPGDAGPGWLTWVESTPRRLALCSAGVAVLAWSLAGTAWIPAGVGGGLVVGWWVGRLEPPSTARDRERVQRDLPLAVDLLVAAALAGQPLDRSVDVVAGIVGGPLGASLQGVRARIQLGADSGAEWRLLRGDPALGRLARAITRSVESGAPLAASLTRLSHDLRARARAESQRRARSVGVRAAAPLGICFLPAFMVIGVVPTIAGSFERLLG